MSDGGGRGLTRGCAEHHLGVTEIEDHNKMGFSGFKADEGREAVDVGRE